MEVARQISPVEVADRHSPNLLTFPMVDRMAEAASRVRWHDVETHSSPRQSVERLVQDIDYVASLANGASSSMKHAYEHVASDMARRMSDGIGRSVSNGGAVYASPSDEAMLTDPVKAQHEAGLQRRDKGPGLAQPLFSTVSMDRASRILNGISSRIGRDLGDPGGREVLEAVTKVDFAVEARRSSPGADKQHTERTGEEQRTLASYNAIATEGLIKASAGLASRAHLLHPSELEVVRSTIAASDRRAEVGSVKDAKAPDHVAERRGQIHAAMVAGAMQR